MPPVFRAGEMMASRGRAVAVGVAIVCAFVLATTALGAGDDGTPATGPRYPVIVHRGASLPPPSAAQKVPLLIALHASGGSPSWFEQVSQLDTVADRYGFVVAYLSSRTPTAPAWRFANQADDLAYIRAEIQRLVVAQNIDPKRVYATGFSAGATMSFFVGCLLSKYVSGIAVVSGAMRFTDTCTLAHPVSELLVIGTKDVIPFEGTPILLSADQVAAKWRALDTCTGPATTSTDGPVDESVWTSCDDRAAVGLDVVQNGNHQWPGGPKSSGADAKFDAADALWAFFTAHPGPTSLTVPSASLKAVSVHATGAKRWIEGVVAAAGSRVTARLALRRAAPGAAARTVAHSVARGTTGRLLVRLPAAAPAGRYALTLTLADAYGRTATTTRTVTLPAAK
jgi:polyhydroxybutyrate depolymerase